ncbi:MAG TPA: VOC family protein [Microthrixaceae bacterium]|nr:VOC family protein [Microthrixaceae bacterium]
MPVVHHSAICTRDIDASLRFWRDGMGMAVTMDLSFEGDWPTLFDAPTTTLRSIFLGDPASPDAGIVELVDLGPIDTGEPNAQPRTGFFLLSFMVDVEEVLARLARIGVGGEPRRIAVHGVDMAVIVDPNGVRVELIEATSAKSP